MTSQMRLSWIVAGSLAAGVVSSLALAIAPGVVPAQEDGVTAAVLLGFAVGWAMLAALSTRFTSAPQRWAVVPAAFMAIGALVLATIGSSARPAIDWVWPPAALVLAVWMMPRARRIASGGGRGGRRLLTSLAAVLALAAVGAACQSVAAAADASDRARSMPGRLVDVGGHRLHLVCSGSGSPTVVMEPGAGEMAASLAWITAAVARTTRVCVYDRAGRGWSEATAAPQNGARVADDLHTLLHRAGVPGPYVLAGHSFGGLYVLAFAARHPDEVCGMVLIDSTAPATASAAGSATGEGAAGDGPMLRRVAALLSTTSRLGASRLYAAMAFGDLPPRARDDVRASVATTTTVRSTLEEYLAGSASTQDAAALADFGDKPLVVLTAGAGHPESWFAAQDRLATLSSRSVHTVVDGATHEGLVAQARYAAVTARAIAHVATSVRTTGADEAGR